MNLNLLELVNPVFNTAKMTVSSLRQLEIKTRLKL